MWAFVMLKDLSAVKQRLSSALNTSERGALVLAMASDLLATLTKCSGLERLVVCSPNAQAEQLARQWHVDFMSEAQLPVRGNVNLVANAMAEVLGEQGARDVLCIPGDVPLLTPGELAFFCEAHKRLRKPSVTAAPDRHGTGTNLIAWQPKSGFSVAFGPGSLERHRARAQQIGASMGICRTLGGGLDIDEPADLALLLRETDRELAPATRRYLAESGLTGRLLPVLEAGVDGAFA